jgi:hypothetical protein
MSLVIIFLAVAILAAGILTMGGPWMQKLIVANLFGVAFSAVAAVGAALFNTVSGSWEWISWAFPCWALGSGLLALMDLGYRYLSVQRKQEPQADGSSSSFRNRWLALTTGASLIVVPAWIVGALLAVVLGVLSVLDLLWMARQSGG